MQKYKFSIKKLCFNIFNLISLISLVILPILLLFCKDEKRTYYGYFLTLLTSIIIFFIVTIPIHINQYYKTISPYNSNKKMQSIVNVIK